MKGKQIYSTYYNTVSVSGTQNALLQATRRPVWGTQDAPPTDYKIGEDTTVPHRSEKDAANLRQPRRLKVGKQEDVEHDQEGKEPKNHEGVHSPHAIVVLALPCRII